MKHGWEYKKLGEVVTSSDLGKTLNQSKDTGTMRPYLCAVNILWDKIDLTTLKETRFEESELERYTVSKGDLLICEGGDTGRAAIWDKTETILYQNALHRLRFKGQTDTRFVLFFLKYLKDTGELDHKYCKGVTIKHLVKSSLLSIPIPNPPLSVQKSIVSELDKINELICLKKEQLSDYDKLAQSLFYEMFGDPIENEKGWEVKTIGDVCSLKSGDSKANKSPKGTLPYVKVGDMNLPGNENYITYSSTYVDRTFNQKGIFPIGSILFPKRGGAILTNKKRMAAVEVCCDLNTMGVIPSEGLNIHYLFQWFKILDLGAICSGSTILQLNNCDIAPLLIQIPPLSLQNLFAQRIELIEKQKAEIKSTIADLETLLASRMQYWFFGF